MSTHVVLDVGEKPKSLTTPEASTAESRLKEIVRVHESLLSRPHLNYESIIKQETVDEIHKVRTTSTLHV
jgi:hypothetical protein